MFRAYSGNKAKTAALSILLHKDFENGFCYQQPEINEISEDIYVSEVSRALEILTNSTIIHALLISIFGIEPEYDEDQQKRAVELFFDPRTNQEAYSDAMRLNKECERVLSEYQDISDSIAQGDLTTQELVKTLHNAVQSVISEV